MRTQRARLWIAGLAVLSGCLSPRVNVVRPAPPVAASVGVSANARVDSAAAIGDRQDTSSRARSIAPVPSATPLERLADSLVAAPEFDGSLWGILVVDATTGDTLLNRNARALVLPASNEKLITSSVALTRLGAAYTFRTILAARGRVRRGKLNGDLLVIGRGDPSVSDHMQGDAMKPLMAMADSLAAHGIRSVSGRVLAAGNAFPGPTLGYAWSWDDFEADYGAPTDELLFNEGFSTLDVHAGSRVGAKVRVTTKPAHTWPRFVVEAKTRSRTAVGEPLGAIKDSVHGDVRVTGTLALRDSARLIVTDRDPDAAYVAAFTEALASRGITVRGGRADSTASVDTLFTMHSPPLSDVLAAMLLPSQNQIAEMVFKTVGLEGTGIGSSDSAAAVVRRQLAEWGIPAEQAVVHDGSGLSRQDFVTARTLVRVLDVMRQSPDFNALWDALPVAGRSGTLDSRMRGTVAEGNAHAKTGSMTAVRSLSGYVTAANRHVIEFSIIANNFVSPSRSVARVQDAIVTYLAGATVP